jgi:hypothetical protein
MASKVLGAAMLRLSFCRHGQRLTKTEKTNSDPL